MFRRILESFSEGNLTHDEAERAILSQFYENGEDFLLDLHREKRIGFPEVIYAAGKKKTSTLCIARRILASAEIVFVSGLDGETSALLEGEFGDFDIRRSGDLMAIRVPGSSSPELGCAGIVTAGTSDIPYAEQCVLMLEALGVKVICSHDSGAAGIHRHYLGIKQMKDADVIILFAGMDGVLPTMAASLTDLPVIAVPTPVGYGHGGCGEAALTTMLQSCTPGVLVVNIGNVVGAAAGAIRIMRRISSVESAGTVSSD